MELDKRIKSLSDILTCFDVERAKEFLGEKGYFAGDLYCFTDLRRVCPPYGTLADVFDDPDDTFRRKEDSIYYPYFVPECSLKPKEKQYRPYTFMEFTDKFTVGRPIKFRQKGAEGYERYLILNGYQHEQHEGRTVTYIYIGSQGYTLDALFNDYEWQEHYTEDFKPFGVEVKE